MIRSHLSIPTTLVLWQTSRLWCANQNSWTILLTCLYNLAFSWVTTTEDWWFYRNAAFCVPSDKISTSSLYRRKMVVCAICVLLAVHLSYFGHLQQGILGTWLLPYMWAKCNYTNQEIKFNTHSPSHTDTPPPSPLPHLVSWKKHGFIEVNWKI